MTGLLLLAAWTAQPADADANLGRRLFDAQCALCHGIGGAGGRGPVLARAQLKHAPTEEALKTVIEQGLPGTEMPGSWQLSPRETGLVAAYVRGLGKLKEEVVPGDPVRGAKVYAGQGCAGCHAVAGEGSGYGPELTSIGARRSAAYLHEALVRPGAAVPEDFLVVEAVGRATVRGIRVNEDSFTIQLKDPQGFHSFRKSELRSLRKLAGETPMPAYGKLAPAELTDLVAYLVSLKGRP
ncbi:MAG: c-type cytochrome [Acidobacteria bacterium]|nr:c-type cytochrome [Acidobacteriota bacterium]